METILRYNQGDRVVVVQEPMQWTGHTTSQHASPKIGQRFVVVEDQTNEFFVDVAIPTKRTALRPFRIRVDIIKPIIRVKAPSRKVTHG